MGEIGAQGLVTPMCWMPIVTSIAQEAKARERGLSADVYARELLERDLGTGTAGRVKAPLKIW